MIVLAERRGTVAWREAHAGRISASDAGALLARPETKSYRALIDRLVLDVEGIGNHTDAEPDPWQQQHDIELNAALACYQARRPHVVLQRNIGFVIHDKYSWLGASPHALIEADPPGVLMLHPHRAMRRFHVAKSTRAARAREQIVMFVTGTSWCEAVDFWNGLGEVRDKIKSHRVEFDLEWLTAHVFPRFVKVWRDVAAQIGLRTGAEAIRRSISQRAEPSIPESRTRAASAPSSPIGTPRARPAGTKGGPNASNCVALYEHAAPVLVVPCPVSRPYGSTAAIAQPTPRPPSPEAKSP